MDGWMSGAIVKLRYPDAKFYGYNYGQDVKGIEWDGQEVIMCDATLPFKSMVDVLRRCASLLVIDHHVGIYKEIEASSEFKLAEEQGKFVYVYTTERSACELTWMHLMDDEIPTPIELIGKNDSWRESGTPEWNNLIMPMQFALQSIIKSVDDALAFIKEYIQRHGASLEQLIEYGKVISKYVETTNEARNRSCVYEIEFEGHKAVCLNSSMKGSQQFGKFFKKDKHEIMLVYAYGATGYWNVSIYTEREDIECNAIAKKFGGGGHRKASGFRLETNDLHLLLKAK
jgi:oligoribonuclease NrnB/cAMP/cGMP phosphodiesterase (DHH superfamily)